MIEAIIFDLDDTIVNSSFLHFTAYEQALMDFGIKTPKLPEELRQSIYGMRIKEIMEILADHFQMKVDVAELTSHRDKYFMKLVKKGVEPMPGLFELVENIKKWGFKCAVASSGVPEYVDEVINQLKLKDFFSVVVTGNDVLNPKPAPDAFIMAAKGLSTPPSRCAVIEDATKGIEAAKAAGCLAIALKSPVTGSNQDLSKADHIVSRLDQITLDILGRNV